MIKQHQSTAFAEGFLFLEGPRWHDGALFVSDIFDGCVYRVALDGSKTVVVKIDGHVSGLGFLPDGTPLVVSMSDRKVLKVVRGIAEPYADLAGVAAGDANDMIVDSKGRAYVGNLGYDMMGGEPLKPADIAFIDVDGSVRVAAKNAEFPNGMAFLNDERVLVVAETWAHRLVAYDREADGTLINRRVFAATGERTPDGIAVDCEDGIWFGSFTTNEYVRVLEGGEVTDRIAYPGWITPACALGGPNGKTLFCLTMAGDLEDIKAGRRKAMVETVAVDIACPGHV